MYKDKFTIHGIHRNWSGINKGYPTFSNLQASKRPLEWFCCRNKYYHRNIQQLITQSTH